MPEKNIIFARIKKSFMIRLCNDYSNGAHPEVLRKIIELNMAGEAGYGEDSITLRARELIIDKCGLKDAAVHFVAGGTQANKVALDRILRPCEGVLCAEDAHINVHEAGAIEKDGHKVIVIESRDGKISGPTVAEYMQGLMADPTWPHRVVPGAVYITQPTERGTIYSSAELESMRDVCDSFGLKLYVDGARLAYALGSPANEVTLSDLARLSDAFYIGGTKCGALFGEALVFPGDMDSSERIRLFSHIKRHGALSAKGWLIASQFLTLMTDNLYERIGAESVSKALMLKAGLADNGIRPAWDSATNQQFFIVPNEVLASLSPGSLIFDYWGAPGKDESIIRLVTDWSTPYGAIQRAVDLFS